MAGKLLNRCSVSLVIREMQMQTRMSYCISMRTLKIKHQCWQGSGASQDSHIPLEGVCIASTSLENNLATVSLNP